MMNYYVRICSGIALHMRTGKMKSNRHCIVVVKSHGAQGNCSHRTGFLAMGCLWLPTNHQWEHGFVRELWDKFCHHRLDHDLPIQMLILDHVGGISQFQTHSPMEHWDNIINIINIG